MTPDDVTEVHQALVTSTNDIVVAITASKAEHDDNGRKRCVEWKGHLLKGGEVVLDHEWIRDNFEAVFPLFYRQLLNKRSLKQKLRLPSGARPKAQGEPSSYLLTDGQKLLPHRNNTNLCLWTNIANALELFNFGDLAHTCLTEYLPQYDVERKLKGKKTSREPKRSSSDLARAVWRLRNTHKWLCKKIDCSKYDLLGANEEDRQCIKVVMLQSNKQSSCHVICVFSNTIIDGTHSHTLPLDFKHLNWCCGADKDDGDLMYVGIQEGYLVSPPKTFWRKQTVDLCNADRFWEHVV